MKTKKIFAILLVGTITFSCAKEKDTPEPVEEPTTTPAGTSGSGNTSGNAQPSFAGADASLWAIKSLSVTTVAGLPPITTTIGTGVATFLDGSSSFVGAGTVKLNTNTLTQNPNNSYVFVPGASMPTGITFTNVSWDVTGANGFTAFTKNVTIGFPNVSQITSSATVTKSSGYTITVNTVSGADSVIFLVGGVNKTIAGNATSCTFSASELSSLSTGTASAQVAAYISTNETVGGKVIYYGNETVQSKSVTVQ